MKSILFVDDEPNVLAGLKRVLRPMRHEWEMDFVDSGQAALHALAAKPCDVIVSDMRMPGMNGVELLGIVSQQFPLTVRIALSGHAEMDMILESARVTHQYLAKPCDAQMLMAALGHACASRELLADEALGMLVGRIDSLPSVPTLYIELMDEINAPDSSIAKVGDIIAKDVGMTAKILQLVNSAFFGLRRHISTPSQAATLLGLGVIKNLALSTKVFASLDNGQMGGLNIDALCRHSRETGALARKIAGQEGLDKKVCDYASLAGMLHDLGELVLASCLPEQWRTVPEVVARETLCATDAEREIFGCTHMEVGAYLLALWGLPNPIVEALAFHHVPTTSCDKAFSPLTAVHVADALLSGGESAMDAPEAGYLDMDYLARLGLTDRVSAWVDIYHEFQQLEATGQ